MRYPDDGFESFLQRHATELAAIARWSRGEYTLGDVQNDAYVRAYDLGAKRGHPLDLEDADDAALLLRRLRNHFRYADVVVRRAQRLDHAAAGDGDRGHHWLMDVLAADNGEHPLSLLEALESYAPEPELPGPYHSEIAAWQWLLERFDRRMADIATFLLISVSWCHACRRRARHRAGMQWPLPHDLLISDDEIGAIQPWRKFKLPTRVLVAPSQLTLDYWNQPSQPRAGQLWLL